jgi:hypothetical protein
MSNILFGSFLGVVSGRYIFEEPIKEYWENEQEAQGRTKGSKQAPSSGE